MTHEHYIFHQHPLYQQSRWSIEGSARWWYLRWETGKARRKKRHDADFEKVRRANHETTGSSAGSASTPASFSSHISTHISTQYFQQTQTDNKKNHKAKEPGWTARKVYEAGTSHKVGKEKHKKSS